jgi:hypothetical protein
MRVKLKIVNNNLSYKLKTVVKNVDYPVYLATKNIEELFINGQIYPIIVEIED